MRESFCTDTQRSQTVVEIWRHGAYLLVDESIKHDPMSAPIHIGFLEQKKKNSRGTSRKSKPNIEFLVIALGPRDMIIGMEKWK